MNKTPLILGLIVTGLCLATLARAEIYKSVDANGHITYSNIPAKGATRLNLEPPGPANSGADRASRAKTATPANFPRVDRQTQSQRDDKRKQILQDELVSEKQALDDARKARADAELASAANRNNKANPNQAKPDDKLQTDINAHEKNIQLLQKELDSLK